MACSARVAVAVALVLVFVPSSARLAEDPECITLEDFSTSRVGEFPAEWKPRKDAGRTVYVVKEESSRRYLHASARGLGIQAARQHEWNPSAYPVLAWSWRPLLFPDGADERKSGTNDSALGVYAVWPHSPVSVKSLKYVWSATVPRGSRFTSSRGLTHARVLRSGTEGKGAWIEERVNVLEDYRTSFGDAEVPRAAGIAVLTDADDTRSSAEGDYANFRLCRR